MERMPAASIHNRELQDTFEIWQRKPLIRQVYNDFYLRIRTWLVQDHDGCTVELGAGFGGLKSVQPTCIATDLFATPWISQTENVYRLPFEDSSIANLVMMDVFHHESLGLRQQIKWHREESESDCPKHYAAQANAFRIFFRGEFKHELEAWRILRVQRLASFSYLMAGGLRKRQLYPTAAYRMMKWIDCVLNFFPWLFATRMLVVLEKGVIAIDGNGKDGVEAIAVFEDCLMKGFDFVQGSRFMTGGTHSNTPWDRYFGIRFFLAPLMSIAAGYWYTDPTNGFKGMSRRFLLDDRVRPFRSEFQQFNLQFYLNYVAPRLGFTVMEMPVSRRYPKGVSTPTKIIGIRAKWTLLRQFFGVILGRYNVTKGRRDARG